MYLTMKAKFNVLKENKELYGFFFFSSDTKKMKTIKFKIFLWDLRNTLPKIKLRICFGCLVTNL